MLDQKGANTSVVGIEGNFDDAQTGVKKIFGEKRFAKELDAMGFQLSSANSINIGRLVSAGRLLCIRIREASCKR